MDRIIEVFDGEERDVEPACDNELMKSVIDKFGENIHMGRINDNQFKATVTVAASKTFYAWCFCFAGQMKIAGPRKAKKQYLEREKKILE